jgi:hypothetical protein
LAGAQANTVWVRISGQPSGFRITTKLPSCCSVQLVSAELGIIVVSQGSRFGSSWFAQRVSKRGGL